MCSLYPPPLSLQVEQLLVEDPDNEEYKSILESLTEVIKLTRDVLTEAVVPAGQSLTTEEQKSSLPTQVAQQIRSAQQRAALGGQGPASWALGAPVTAIYSEDGQWYQGMITAVNPATKNFIVKFDKYGNEEEIKDLAAMKLRSQGKELSIGTIADYQPVAAPKRRQLIDEEDVVTPLEEELPGWMKILPNDDEKTKQKKRKMQKSYKSKLRFQKMDQESKAKADSWKNFQAAGTSKKKKVKKKSMFSVPEHGAGVLASRGLTEYKKPTRHTFSSSK